MSTKAELEERFTVMRKEIRRLDIEVSDLNVTISSNNRDKRELKAHCQVMSDRIQFLEGYLRRIEEDETIKMQMSGQHFSRMHPTGYMHAPGVDNCDDVRPWFEI